MSFSCLKTIISVLENQEFLAGISLLLLFMLPIVTGWDSDYATICLAPI